MLCYWRVAVACHPQPFKPLQSGCIHEHVFRIRHLPARPRSLACCVVGCAAAGHGPALCEAPVGSCTCSCICIVLGQGLQARRVPSAYNSRKLHDGAYWPESNTHILGFATQRRYSNPGVQHAAPAVPQNTDLFTTVPNDRTRSASQSLVHNFIPPHGLPPGPASQPAVILATRAWPTAAQQAHWQEHMVGCDWHIGCRRAQQGSKQT
jgi:hypothetical protein